MGNFGQSAKGGPLAKILKFAIFFTALKGYKILNTSSILASLVWMDAELILVSIDTKICCISPSAEIVKRPRPA